MPQHRIVSLIASATEIVAALGLEKSLVGISHECDFPPSIHRLPACSEAKIDVNGTSREIDDRVKAVLKQAISVYRVHTDVLEQLEPTVIITQTQCEVCAVSLKDVEAAVCELVRSQPKVVALEPNSLDDVYGDIIRVAEAVGVAETGEQLIDSLKARLQRISQQTAALKSRPSIACIEWIDPLMAAGNWVPELVELAGGIDPLGNAGEHSGYMTFGDLRAADPNVIAIMPCGFDIPRAEQELSVLTERPDWQTLKAVQSGRVYVTDGNQYFNRPGPRLVESAEILAEILHPGEFNFGHAGTGWKPLC
ncbi:MAG: cobalamin-binding protein [Planctomycetaceae bacterium]|jgi:iron complex transport system substrate-binding protein|nr:cobalamin-binding protein [Planctomycetaceae bacterium]MBT6484645.1 cobalamin-binding protein [Planctomycetaceae bacterium]MBT6494831.1 cobalamin-binding protein [Planctomycetaceae bacterium]